MAENSKPPAGSVTWRDLTVPDAEKVRDFYSKVVGWTYGDVSMGDYNDFVMNLPGSGETVAGICHARGTNANLPPQWLIYITVEDIDKSIESCITLGGKVIDGPKKMGSSRYCIIQDPAGAYCALFQH